MRTLRSLRSLHLDWICLFALAGLLAASGPAGAEQQVASRLLLPYFEVDLDSGVTTLFAVANASGEAADFQIILHSNWGIPVLTVPASVEGHGVLTVNLAHWLVDGTLPDETLSAEQLEHLQAALCGQLSAQSDLFYSTEIAPRLAVGYVRIEAFGYPRPKSLWGDYFILDSFQEFAQGEALISLEAECVGPCVLHSLRYLAGGPFDGGTEVFIWNGREGEPSGDGYFPDDELTTAQSLFFNEAGQALAAHSFGFLPVEKVTIAELGLSDPFGWLELMTEHRSFVGLRFSALGRYSVGLRSFCMPEPIGPGIRIEKYTNDEDADEPRGPEIPVGDPVHWKYVVTNSGDRDLHDVQVTDDRDVDVTCPQDTLAVGESMTCTASGIAVAGQYENCGVATSLDPEGQRVNDIDCSHYWGLFCDHHPAIDIEKATNGEDADFAPGVPLLIGDDVEWTYVVTNTGDVALENVAVSDNRGVALTCDGDRLEPSDFLTCTGDGTAVYGVYENLGTATGISVGSPDCPAITVTDTDPSCYTGGCPSANPAIDIEKATNGEDADFAPGVPLLIGDDVEWTYVVTNTGDVALENVAVSDNRGVALTCDGDRLEPSDFLTCTGDGTAVYGVYENLGTATGISVGSPDCPAITVTDTDPSCYTGGCPSANPAIDIEKATNGEDADFAPGVPLLIGDDVEWTYVVTNTGDVALENVVVSDNRGVALTCDGDRLEPSDFLTCTGDGTAVYGVYENLGTATGISVGSPDCPAITVTDTDPSCYTGGCPLVAIGIEKATNGVDADFAPGPQLSIGELVTWTYEVTNTGDVELENVAVSDDQGVAVTCPTDSLLPDASMICTGSGYAVAGQYHNRGTVTGDGVVAPPCPSAVSDSDPSHYWCPAPGGQGCSPGYWKNHPGSWPPTGYSTDQLVPTVFSQAAAYPDAVDASLLDALNFGGGGGVAGAARILLRASVASVLNAAHDGVSFPRTTGEVVGDVNSALASGDRDTMLALAGELDADNNLGCPLS